jgi:serine/threonine-protein kinase HipA
MRPPRQESAAADYLIKRFDREIDEDSSVTRRHAIDGCQLLNLAATMKYSAWSLESLNELVEHCRAPATARLRMFRWLVFCVAVGNGDSHLKNLSFLVDENGIVLSPHYDLLCDSLYETAGYSARARWPDLAEFTRPIAGVRRYTDFTSELLAQAGMALGLTRTTRVASGRRRYVAPLDLRHVQMDAPRELHDEPFVHHRMRIVLCLRMIRLEDVR